MKFRPFRHKKTPHIRHKQSGEKKAISHLRSRPRTLSVLVRRQNKLAPSVRVIRDPKGRVRFIKIPLSRTIIDPIKSLHHRKRIAAQTLRDKDHVDSIPTMPANHEHCIQRVIRRGILFKVGIAGFNKRKSPGSGGHYNRTEQSKLRC